MEDDHSAFFRDLDRAFKDLRAVLARRQAGLDDKLIEGLRERILSLTGCERRGIAVSALVAAAEDTAAAAFWAMINEVDRMEEMEA